jgi:hypothetical protein
MMQISSEDIGDVFECRLCGHGFWGAVVNKVARNNTPQVSVSCARCAFVQVARMPTHVELYEYYSSGRYRAEFPPLMSEEQEEASASAAARFLATIGIVPGVGALEIGCGYGRVAALTGASALEADPRMAEEAAGRGVSVIDRATPGAYSFVYAMQVLEHQADPIGMLRRWRSYLSSGGRVHVQVPTLEAMYGGSGYWFQKPHLTSWTSRTLTFALIMAGFERVTVGIDGTVLWATAFRSESAAPTYEALAAAVSWPVDDPAQLIASHDAAHAEVNRRGVLSRFLDGGTVDDAELRREVLRLADTFDLARESIAKMAADLGEIARVEGEAYEADAFLYGYRQGKARQSAMVQSTLTALANGLVIRATSEGT